MDLPHQMIFRYRLAKMKLVEQLALVTLQAARSSIDLIAIRVDTTESRFEACLKPLLQQNLPFSDLGVRPKNVHPKLAISDARNNPRTIAPLPKKTCHTTQFSGVYGSGVPIAIRGYFFVLASNSPTIFRTGPKIQLSVMTLSWSSRGLV